MQSWNDYNNDNKKCHGKMSSRNVSTLCTDKSSSKDTQLENLTREYCDK